MYGRLREAVRFEIGESALLETRAEGAENLRRTRSRSRATQGFGDGRGELGIQLYYFDPIEMESAAI